MHATAEPIQTLDAGWDVAAIEGETTLLKLVDAGVTGLAYRDADGNPVKAGRVERNPLDTFRAFSLRWNRFSAWRSREDVPLQAQTTYSHHVAVDPSAFKPTIRA